MKLMKRIQLKIKNRRGESIAETLIALLISSGGLLMLATMITSGARMVEKSRDTMSGYYARNNAVAAMETYTPDSDEEEARFTKGNVTLQLKTDTAGDQLKPQTFAVVYYENDWLKTKPVISYQLQSEASSEGGAGGGN